MADKNYGIQTTVVDEIDDRDRSQGHTLPQQTGSEDHKPVFDRYISFLGIANFCFCIQGAWEAIGLMLSLGFWNGGPASMVWGCFLAGVGNIAVSSSMGEMAAMDPTVGAQYRWSARFARSNNEFWGLLQGWLTTVSWVIAGVSSPQMLSGVITALIAFYNPEYEAKPWHATLIIWAFLLLALFFNLYLRWVLNVLETMGGVCHILFFVAIVVTLATLGERSSADYVFTTIITDASGWTNPGISFHLGLSLTLLVHTGADSALHMVDETKKPRKRVPYTMVASTAANVTFSIAYLICILFFIGDKDKVYSSTMPIIQIYYHATKSKKATTIMVLMHVFIVFISSLNIIASATRLVWAFARDKGLPCHKYFSQVNTRFQTPLQALGLVMVVAVLLSLINLGSSVALSAIISLNALANLVSYSIPITLLMIRKIAGEHPRYGPFQLGRWGIPVNFFSVCYLVWNAFWVCFPTAYPVTGKNMNYAAPIFIAVVIAALADWFTSGKKRFQVPTGVYTIEMDNIEEKKDRKGSNGGSNT